ncbi:hypothetical protein PCE1_000573 [Barthelona sp. PCE]
MNSSEYDKDVSTFNPEGKLQQIRYAFEAVKLGACIVGLVSEESGAVVIASYRRKFEDLAECAKKTVKLYDHMGMTVSGLNADVIYLIDYLQQEADNWDYVYESDIPIQKIANNLALKIHKRTIRYGNRPYGVGVLLAGVDRTGPKLYCLYPSGSAYQFHCHTLGARSESAKTYLDVNAEAFKTASTEELILHAIRALNTTLKQETLSAELIDVSIVTNDTPFSALTPQELDQYVNIVLEPQNDE